MTAKKISLTDARLRRLAYDLAAALEEQQPRWRTVTELAPDKEGEAEVTVKFANATEAREHYKTVRHLGISRSVNFGIDR